MPLTQTFETLVPFRRQSVRFSPLVIPDMWDRASEVSVLPLSPCEWVPPVIVFYFYFFFYPRPAHAQLPTSPCAGAADRSKARGGHAELSRALPRGGREESPARASAAAGQSSLALARDGAVAAASVFSTISRSGHKRRHRSFVDALPYSVGEGAQTPGSLRHDWRCHARVLPSTRRPAPSGFS
jgi:hypothetical protein